MGVALRAPLIPPLEQCPDKKATRRKRSFDLKAPSNTCNESFDIHIKSRSYIRLLSVIPGGGGQVFKTLSMHTIRRLKERKSDRRHKTGQIFNGALFYIELSASSAFERPRWIAQWLDAGISHINSFFNFGQLADSLALDNFKLINVTESSHKFNTSLIAGVHVRSSAVALRDEKWRRRRAI